MPRLAVPLTDTAVRNAKPDASKPKGHTLPDGGGLYLHVTQAGKYWRMDYRRPNGKRNTLAFERANTRLVMLIGTLEYVTNHCTDTNLAGALDLLSVGAEDLQALVGERLEVAPSERDCERIRRLVITLVQACGLVDALDYPDECGVIGLVNLAMADLHADVSAWLSTLGQQQAVDQEAGRLYPTTVRGEEEAGPGGSLEERFTKWSQSVGFGRGSA